MLARLALFIAPRCKQVSDHRSFVHRAIELPLWFVFVDEIHHLFDELAAFFSESLTRFSISCMTLAAINAALIRSS